MPLDTRDNASDGGETESDSDESVLAVEDRILQAMEAVDLTGDVEEGRSVASDMEYSSDSEGDGYSAQGSPRKRSRR